MKTPIPRPMELFKTTLSPPICAKHGCEKVWRKDRHYKNGGRWRCLECYNATTRAGYPTSAGKARDQVRHLTDPERNKRTYRRNPEGYLARNHRRRARKLAATSPFAVVTAAIEAERKALTDGCAFCGAQKKLELEHVVALNDGGMHVPSNLVGACISCNRSKSDKPVETWFRAQPFFSEQRWQRIQTITGDGQLSLI